MEEVRENIVGNAVVKMKKCSKCGVEKEKCEKNFRLRKFKNKTSFYPQCLECSREYGRKYVKEHKEKHAAYNKEYAKNNPDKIKAKQARFRAKHSKIKRKMVREINVNGENMKMRICSKCGEEKEENKDNFYNRDGDKQKFIGICKKCDSEIRRERFAKNPEKYRQLNRKYKENQYSNKKRDRSKEYEKEKERCKIDTQFKLRKLVSRSIAKALKNNGSSKNGSVKKHLPFTLDELKSHLEAQFDEHMNWNNHGTFWHIDHIIPHSDFNYTSMDCEEFRKCWSLSNLRPLEAKQNIIDGARRTRHRDKTYRKVNKDEQ